MAVIARSQGKITPASTEYYNIARTAVQISAVRAKFHDTHRKVIRQCIPFSFSAL